jgi:hypothetical protein
MLTAKHRKRHIRECQVDDTLLHVGSDRLLVYGQLRKRRATSRDTDVCLKRLNVYRKIERQGESHGRVITTGGWIICGSFREEQLEFIELNRLDDVDLPSIRENSLNDEVLDSVV